MAKWGEYRPETGRSNAGGREKKDKPRVIPEHEMRIETARAGGPGGQNINKRETKVILTWVADDSMILTPEEKRIVRENHGAKDGENVVLQFHCRELRSQGENKAACVKRLHARLEELLKVPEERVATKKSRGRRSRELDSKTKEGRKKQDRRKVDFD